MQSLRDKNRTKENRLKLWISGGVFVVLVLVAPFIFPWLGNGMRTILRPLWNLENGVVSGTDTFVSYFASKHMLEIENQSLKSQLIEMQARMADRATLAQENASLKEILGRTTSNNLILGTILVKPNRSLYDTLVIDIGADNGIKVGDTVFAYGTTPIGLVSSTGGSSATVTLFSTSGQKTTGRIDGKNIDVELIGRGGGNFQLQVPRDITLEPNTNVLFPGITPEVIAVVASSITDARDPTQTFLLTSPVNINELNWVEVEK